MMEQSNIPRRSFLALLLVLMLIASCQHAVGAWTMPPSNAETGVASSSARRNLFESAVVWAAPVVVIATAVVSSSAPANAADDNANNDNAFIVRLKAQSDANKAAYQQQAQSTNKLSPGQFSSQYQRPKYTGVKKADGSAYVMVTSDELQDLIAKKQVQEIFEMVTNKKSGSEKIDYSKGKRYGFVK